MPPPWSQLSPCCCCYCYCYCYCCWCCSSSFSRFYSSFSFTSASSSPLSHSSPVLRQGFTLSLLIHNTQFEFDALLQSFTHHTPPPRSSRSLTFHLFTWCSTHPHKTKPLSTLQYTLLDYSVFYQVLFVTVPPCTHLWERVDGRSVGCVPITLIITAETDQGEILETEYLKLKNKIANKCRV